VLGDARGFGKQRIESITQGVQPPLPCGAACP
jgi:hypothetical protein